MANTIRAGKIVGDPTDGLCERICIEVPRVFDGCRETRNNQNFLLTLTGVPPQATPPFTFVEAVSYGDATVENESVTSEADNVALFEIDIVIPVLVTFTDVNAVAYTATSSIRLHREYRLRIPDPSIVPYKLKVFAAFVSRIGSFMGNDAVSVSGCYTIVAKIVVMTDILVPTYGVCVYPTCCRGTDACAEFVSLPLFPDD